MNLRFFTLLFQLACFVKCKQTLLELNSWELYPSSEKERKLCRALFKSSIKREITHFHVVVVQWRQRNVQQSVLPLQSCCFAHLTHCFFWRSRCYPIVKRANAFYARLGQVVIQFNWLFVFFFQPGEHYVSITNYSPTAEGPEDLPLTTGEIVRLLTEDGAWAFVCTLDQTRRRGWVPSSILKKKGGIPLSQR